jgi:hypothetical protein
MPMHGMRAEPPAVISAGAECVEERVEQVWQSGQLLPGCERAVRVRRALMA